MIQIRTGRRFAPVCGRRSRFTKSCYSRANLGDTGGASPTTRRPCSMWSGFDPEFVRQLGTIRQLVTLRYQSPTREWPLVFVDEHDLLFVIREWPDGSMTA